MSIENQANPSYKPSTSDPHDESTPEELLSDALAQNNLRPLSLPTVQRRIALLERFQPTRAALDVVWNGLTSLAGRKPAPERIKQDTQVIFASLEKVATLYGLFVGPATVISIYQYLLKLAGVNPDMAFPNGTWQFYVEYALREDTARHTVETRGFDAVLGQHKLQLSHCLLYTSPSPRDPE